jgi:hypothetical protein
LDENPKIPSGDRPGNLKFNCATAAGQLLSAQEQSYHFLLPIIKLCFDSRGDETDCAFRNIKPLIISIGAGECDDKKAVVLAESGCVEAVIQHGVVHTGETA